jgi:hypothetical protein
MANPVNNTPAPVQPVAPVVPVAPVAPVQTPAAPAASGNIFSNLWNRVFGSSTAPVVPVVPVVPAPVVPAPVAPAPVVPAPVAPAPVVPAPVAPAPVAPAPVVPAPVVPAVNAADAEIETALNSLLRCDNVETLYATKVTNAPWYTKLFGLISYAWNKKAALEQDKVATNFSNAATVLTKSVAFRYLSEQERGTTRVQYNDDTQADNYVALETQANTSLQEFHAAFKARITSLNVNESSAAFGKYTAAAQKLIRNLGKDFQFQGNQQKQLAEKIKMGIKIDTTVESFNKKVFTDMVETFARQPLVNISIDGFKNQVALLKRYFNLNDQADVEAKLRLAIKANHDTLEIQNLSGAYANPDNATNTYFTAFRQVQQAVLTPTRDALEAERRRLCGPNGNDGEIDVAYRAQQAAQTVVTNAGNALSNTLATALGNANALSVASAVTFVTNLVNANAVVGGVPVSTFRTLIAELETANAALTVATQAFNDKVARLAVIAQYDNQGAIVGGELNEANANLQDTALDSFAGNQANRVANFYAELNEAITDANRQARCLALNAIIGN